MEFIKKLFTDPQLDIWANVLEVIGFIISILSLIVGLFVKSQLQQLRTTYLFDKRVNKHVQNLKQSTTELNRLLNDYDNNRDLIKIEFGKCLSELRELKLKIPKGHSRRTGQMISFLSGRNKRPFAKKRNSYYTLIEFAIKYPIRIYETSYNDVWDGYGGINEIIIQMENIKLDRRQSI